MNLLLLDEDDLDRSGGARVRGRRARHVVEVLRAAPGDRIAVGLIRGRTGEAEGLQASTDLVLLSVNLAGEPPPPSPVGLVLALPRPKILRKVLQAVAAMGVKRLALVGTYRVEKSYFASPLLASDAIDAELRLGLEQGKDTVPPQTPTKTDTAAPLGLAGLQAIRRAVKIPLVGIGGLNRGNAAEVVRSGADGVAVVSAIVAAEDPEQAARDLRREIDTARRPWG